MKFNRATKANFVLLKLDIEHPPSAWIPVEKLLKHHYKLGKNQLLVNLEFHFAWNRSEIIDIPPKPLSANQMKAQATAARLEKDRLHHLHFKDSQLLTQTVQEFDDKKYHNVCPNQGNHCWVD